ncbi:Poly(A) RNA polymerase protein [Lachnellula occidentalis]|uniref:polynucleotide adenylyltransferase n=1 Tax=Lachnellula occidentalis TaxID=215460 RepID=A0A8H8U4W8_9HELO|nr:Poly(A) RNA polymerase protein [Lachnellula occidentalis]
MSAEQTSTPVNDLPPTRLDNYKMSRQPPPPARLFSGSTYRPNNDSYRASNDNYRRSPPRDMYQFGGSERNSRPGYDQRGPSRYDAYPSSYATDSYAPGTEPHRNSDSYRPAGPRDGGFNFRHEPPPGVNFNQGRNHQPRSHSRSPPPRQSYQSRESNGYNRDYQRDRENYVPQLRPQHNGLRGGSRGRGRGGSRLAADRAFLKTNRAPTPELMPGMDEQAGTIRYKAVDEMSDSEEAEMDLSDSEKDDEAQQPTKKLARTDNKAADGDSVPKWSNPDPYTALPPPDESQRKKKDVVKLIRKARVTNSSENTVKSAASDDFISFDFGNEEEAEDAANESVNGPMGAPTGPRTQQPQALKHTQLREYGFTQNQSEEASRTSSHGPTTSQPGPSRFEIQIPSRPSPANAPKRPAAFVDLTSDPALGNRKRNIRDEIKGPPMIHTPSAKGIPKGEILSSWKIRPGSQATPTPWIELDHSKTANMGLWLHKEIVDFYYHVKPRDFEQRIRANLVDELRVSVKKYFRDSNVLSFGSFPAGLYLPTSDMDIVCVSDQFMRNGNKTLCKSNNQYHHFARFLQQEKIPIPGSVEVITKAKVPIIKFVDRLTGLKVDISFENDTGLVANKTFQEWKTEFPAMPILVTLVKHLLAMRGLNEPHSGGIGGFSVICLVHMPQVQSRNMLPEEHLGEILMEFFDLYGNQLNTATTAISMKPPGYVPKNQVKKVTYKGNIDKISIIDPNTPSNDISGGSSNTSRILECFSKAYRDLQKRMGDLQVSPNRVNESILGCILGGNYSSFDLQRNHLAHVHEKLFGPIQEEFA